MGTPLWLLLKPRPPAGSPPLASAQAPPPARPVPIGHPAQAPPLLAGPCSSSASPAKTYPQCPAELLAFLEGRGGAPLCELWLCLGEPWPEPGPGWTRRLIMVQVVPVALRLLLELGRAQGASSLRSSALQLSASLGQGGLLGALRSWDQRMDSAPPPEGP
uniref:Interferon regulatory factor-3 domain-containing protein n=1 Tax=Nothoprocta perdicaria TaxID=30464 RepID=A0A8C6Z9L7_NOTPE